ncbi:hypothetical protein LEP1GSC034_4792 [Leptospira interrogans str. 2003000735]|uniref:Uncharacterized protein n=4 Tax=Leptospira interrogans TaxID=173 RepID=A0A0E2DA48_LEPIR|nr:hypothetical protein LEP1GSC045_4052 [Leptospira interrogans serovar Pomona str. Kennewicki LC82-25]EKN90384.1 hypothetical protein LEP1GSC027_1803 [Leptospira interrogans str. 2002000624]EKN99498.1 hypothetical protein LEP1GSC014_2326 [Leptospira interrogans serovar Pomona str. Pomona]EKO26198.1 hypothetical protein LEP1GSC104_3339 [Leptospira interrogans str. UI 12621]EKO69504.1 hypothetical protein LEP1GSC069_2274 [Leptospira interrogans serovar Canicola str. Fiocruz LV133]EKQ36261.1 hyp
MNSVKLKRIIVFKLEILFSVNFCCLESKVSFSQFYST